jgi:hypothetical protein
MPLAGLAADGVHDPAVQPFGVAWTDVGPAERARSVLQYHWGRWAAWTPANWRLELAVVRDGTVVGTQGVAGTDFAIRREVATGSWLGRALQGQGIGTQMRAAVLALALAWTPGTRARTPSRTTPPRSGYPASSATPTTASRYSVSAAGPRCPVGCGWTGPPGRRPGPCR